MKNILVLDDNKYILEVLSANLPYYLGKCAVTTAINCAKGAEALSSVSIDLILTDLDIPVVKGYEFIEHARKHYPGIPVCVMTGDCPPAVMAKLKALGVRRWIEKPFHFDKLAGILAEELELQYPLKQFEPGQA